MLIIFNTMCWGILIITIENLLTSVPEKVFWRAVNIWQTYWLTFRVWTICAL